MPIALNFGSGKREMKVEFENHSNVLDVPFGNLQVITEEVEPYDGKYTVTPTVEGEVLPTKDKKMRDDVTVKGIPTYEVHNPSGGTTFYIASSEELIITEG